MRLKAAREAAGADPGVRGVARSRLRGRLRRGPALCPGLAAGTVGVSIGVRAAGRLAPGEAYQFDWSHDVVLINGTTVTVKVAHVRLCHSRMLFVRAYPRETQEMVFDAHDRGFAFFKGTCTRGIYDNMKTAVDAILVSQDRACNRRFLQMCGHYLIDPVACTPASGREPGRAGARALPHPAPAGDQLRGAQCPAAGPVHRLCQGTPASRAPRADQLGGVRAGAAEPGALRRPLRWLPWRDGIGLQDLPGALRHQQVLGA